MRLRAALELTVRRHVKGVEGLEQVSSGRYMFLRRIENMSFAQGLKSLRKKLNQDSNRRGTKPLLDGLTRTSGATKENGESIGQ